jgi:hypothetical protein
MIQNDFEEPTNPREGASAGYGCIAVLVVLIVIGCLLLFSGCNGGFERKDPRAVTYREKVSDTDTSEVWRNVTYELVSVSYDTVPKVRRERSTIEPEILAPKVQTVPKDLVDLNDYLGKFKLKYLATRPVPSLDLSTRNPFDVDADGRTILAVRQNSLYFQGIDGVFANTYTKYGQPIKIDRKKFILFGKGATDSQPLGTSPLKPVWKSWREKDLLENQEVVGTSRDMSGTPVLYVPSDILVEATDDPTSPAATSLRTLNRNMSNLHAGDLTSITLPSDIQEGSSTVRDYEIKFLG